MAKAPNRYALSEPNTLTVSVPSHTGKHRSHRVTMLLQGNTTWNSSSRASRTTRLRSIGAAMHRSAFTATLIRWTLGGST